MQIFLLMILSTFMGGYHYLASPALNVGHDFLPESVRTKTLIMCVINEQKKALDDNSKNLRENGYQFEKTTPCAKSKDVTTTKFCMKDDQISPNCYGQEGYGEEADYLSDHYFITRTDLPKDMSQSSALDYIKKMSGGLPNLGLLFKGEDEKYVVLNPQTMTETVSIPEELIGANSLRKHQIIYFSHHTPSEVEAITESSEWEALQCDDESDIKVFDGETQTWGCRPFDNFKKCFGDTIEDSKGNCVPNSEKKITCSSDERATFNYDALAWECKRRLSIVCESNETLGWNSTLNKYVCMYNAKFTGEDCEDLVFNDQTDEWETVRLGGSASGYPCGACELHQSGTCDDTCFPDPVSIPENLCAGPNCAYECDAEDGCEWIDDCNDGENCASYKTIYWKSDINKWSCVNCYPLKVRSKFKRCFNATIRDTEGYISDASCSHYDESTYSKGAPDWDASGQDSCYLITNDKGEDELQCKFKGSGEFGEEGSGEKRFFCDTDDIDDTNICSIEGLTWAWYDYRGTSPGCMDPYDADGEIQSLVDDETSGNAIPHNYNGKIFTFGCPAGYYRPRAANGPLQECRKSICPNLPPALEGTPSYSDRREGEGCKAGYIDILRTNSSNEGECFYCWIPPEDSNIAAAGPTPRTYLREYFSQQSTTKAAQFQQLDSFAHYTACQDDGSVCSELGTSPAVGAEISCYKDVDGHCYDTPSAHHSPPGWQRTWTNGEWSDPSANWCPTGAPNFPQDAEGNFLSSWATKSQGRCPANYQTKLKGKESNGVFSACIYCLPQPFKVSEVSSLLSEDPNPLPVDPEGIPEIVVAQQPGAWQLNLCYEGVKESAYQYSDSDASHIPDYMGKSYAYARSYCDISIVSGACALGTKRGWVGTWSDCEPNLCRAGDKNKTGMIVPMLLKKDTDNYCVYMWRPPYSGVPPYPNQNATFLDWFEYYWKEITWHNGNLGPDETHYIDYLNDHDHDGEISGLYNGNDNKDNDGYYIDQAQEYKEDGHNYTWTDGAGWDRKQIWCGDTPTTPTIDDTQPDSLFPTTGQLQGSGAEACYNIVQPSLSVWRTCKDALCGDAETNCAESTDFKTCLFTGCDGNANCFKDTEKKDFEFCKADQPTVSPWDPALGWEACETNWCRSDSANRNGKYLVVMKAVDACLYAWKPEYIESKWDGWKTYAFDINADPETNYLTEAACPNCPDAAGYFEDFPDGEEIYLSSGFKAVWLQDTVGWEIRSNWCDGENLEDTVDPRTATLHPWTAKRDEVEWCLRKTQASFEDWGECKKTIGNCSGGDCKTDSFQECLYDTCLLEGNQCLFNSGTIKTSAICASGDQISNWDGEVDGQGWLDCGFNWCDDIAKVDDPNSTNYPWTARVVETCLEPVRSTVTIWNDCKEIHCPSNTCSGSLPFQTCLYEKCKTDTACLETTDSGWDLQTVQLDKPIKQVWDDAIGWKERELNFCSGNIAPLEGLSQLFVTERTVESEKCADIWLPDYPTWDAQSTNPTWELFDQTTPIQDFDFLTCTGTGKCPEDALETTTVGCTLSFNFRTWTEKGGWPDTCDTEIGKCAFESPAENFFRFKNIEKEPDCIEYHRPTWALWEQTIDDANPVDVMESDCDKDKENPICIDEGIEINDGCDFGFMERVWDEIYGWPTTCNLNWCVDGVVDPVGPNDRLLVDDGDCAKLWRPGYSAWKNYQDGTWNAYDNGTFTQQHPCDSDNCPINFEEETDHAECLLRSRYRTWNDDGGWGDCTSVEWCDTNFDDPTDDKRFLVDDGTCGKLWRPDYTAWKTGAHATTATWDAHNANDDTFAPYANCDSDENCPDINVGTTDHTGCLSFFYREWTNTSGWVDTSGGDTCEYQIAVCSDENDPKPVKYFRKTDDKGTTPVDDDCMQYYRPTYDLWEDHDGDLDAMEADCDLNPDANKCADEGGVTNIKDCAHPFLYRKWDDVRGWNDSSGGLTCEEIDWAPGFNQNKETDDERFLINISPDNQASLCRPSFNTWNTFKRSASWNAYRKASGYNPYIRQSCSPVGTKNYTGCLPFAYREWPDTAAGHAEGWTATCEEINWSAAFVNVSPASAADPLAVDDERFLILEPGSDPGEASLWIPPYSTWNAEKLTETWNAYRTSGYDKTPYDCGACIDADTKDNTGCLSFKYREWLNTLAGNAAGWLPTCGAEFSACSGEEDPNPAAYFRKTNDKGTVPIADDCVHYYRPNYALWDGTLTNAWKGKTTNAWTNGTISEMEGYCDVNSGVAECTDNESTSADQTGCTLGFIERQWVNNTTGWSGCTYDIRKCTSGPTEEATKPTGYIRVASTDASGACMRYYRPTYALWKAESGNVGGMESHCNSSTCTDSEGTDTDRTDCTSIGFTYNNWNAASGVWTTGCLNIDWSAGFENVSPASTSNPLAIDDERFLILEPGSDPGEASLWIPSYSVWSANRSTKTWNAYRTSGYSSPYNCGTCTNAATTEVCSGYEYRQWASNAVGWNSCQINWCTGAQSSYNNSGFLLERTTPGTQVGAIADCAQVSRPQPHRLHSGATSLTLLRNDCNGDIHTGAGADTDCFYKSGYASGNVEPNYSTKRYDYESATTVTCPNNVAWDTFATWSDSAGWGSLPSSCAARNCASNDIPGASGEPFTSNQYLSSYYQPKVVTTSCGGGYVDTGKAVGGDATKNCRYCQVDSSNISCPGGMFAYYISGGQLKCDMPAPPIATDETCTTAGMTVLAESDGSVMRWGIPYDPTNWSELGSANLYYYYCQNSGGTAFELHYFTAGTAADNYTCSTSSVVYNGTDPVSNTVTYGSIKIYGNDATVAQNFYDASNFIVCPNNGEVTGWKKNSIVPTD